jgi:hypothetical protein
MGAVGVKKSSDLHTFTIPVLIWREKSYQLSVTIVFFLNYTFATFKQQATQLCHFSIYMVYGLLKFYPKNGYIPGTVSGFIQVSDFQICSAKPWGSQRISRGALFIPR